MNLFNHALLKEYRKERGLTQLEAANRIGVARTTYADYEKGKIQPPIDKLQRISMWLDVPTNKLMQVDNDTGFDLKHIKSDISDLEKMQLIKFVERGLKVGNEFAKIKSSVEKLDLTKQETELIVNLLDYIYKTSYMVTEAEYAQYKILQRKAKVKSHD